MLKIIGENSVRGVKSTFLEELIAKSKYCHYTKKCSFSLRISSVNVTKSAVFCGLVTFTEEIFNEKLHFLCSVWTATKPEIKPNKYRQIFMDWLIKLTKTCLDYYKTMQQVLINNIKSATSKRKNLPNIFQTKYKAEVLHSHYQTLH